MQETERKRKRIDDVDPSSTQEVLDQIQDALIQFKSIKKFESNDYLILCQIGDYLKSFDKIRSSYLTSHSHFDWTILLQTNAFCTKVLRKDDMLSFALCSKAIFVHLAPIISAQFPFVQKDSMPFLHYTPLILREVQCLKSVPKSTQRIALSKDFTELLQEIPPAVTCLSSPDAHNLDLCNLPTTITDLEFCNWKLRDDFRFPRSLTSLSTGSYDPADNIKTISLLPPSLTSLKAVVLAGLPSSYPALPLLTKLSVLNLYGSIPPFVEDLEVKGDGEGIKSLPSSLTSLQIGVLDKPLDSLLPLPLLKILKINMSFKNASRRVQGKVLENAMKGGWDVYPEPFGGDFFMEPRKPTSPSHNLSLVHVKFLMSQIQSAHQGYPSILATGERCIEWLELSQKEIEVIKKNLISEEQYLRCFSAYYDAHVFGSQIQDEVERKAKRHVFWYISLVNLCQALFAQKLAAAHEKGRDGSAKDKKEEHYTQVASAYVIANRGADPRITANLLWNEGQL